MCSSTAEVSQLIQTGFDQVVCALRRAVAEDLGIEELKGILEVAFTERNRLDAAVTGAVGALDQAAERRDPVGELTLGLGKALAARDLHCVWPGCDRPPVWTESHHLDPWVGGGRTEVERMALCCKKHHPKVTAGWRLERGPGGDVMVHPPPPKEPLYGPAVYEPPPGPGP